MIGIAVARGGRRNPEDEESGLLEFLAELEHITREEFHQRSAPPSFASSPAQSKTAKNVQAKHTDDFPPLFEKPKNSTQRLKLELQYLRGKVRDLETELGTVKRKREREREDQFGEAGPESVMERLAKRQLQERIESEKQNASLQATTQKQEKLISSVKKLLSKRQTWDHIQKVEWRDGEEPSQQDMEIFGELLQGIDSRVAMAEAALSTNWSPNFSVMLKHAGATELSFESKYSKLVPFDYRVVDDVLWRSARSGGMATGADQLLVALESTDLVLIKHLVKHPPVVAAPTIVHQAIRRLPGVECVYGVSEVSAVVSGKAAATQPFRLTARGWGRVRPKKLQDGTTGSVYEELTTSTVTLLHPETSKRKRGTSMSREIDLFIQLFVALWKEKHSILHQLMENQLMDAAIAAKVASC